MPQTDFCCACKLHVRPGRASDDAALTDFYEALGQRTLERRFHCAFKGLSRQRIRQLTALAASDPQRVRTFVMTVDEGDSQRIVGHAGWHLVGSDQAEFALVIADGWQGRGLGGRLLQALIHSARRRGLRGLHADVLRSNEPMQAMLRQQGISDIQPGDDPHLLHVQIPIHRLRPHPAQRWLDAFRALLLHPRHPLAQARSVA